MYACLPSHSLSHHGLFEAGWVQARNTFASNFVIILRKDAEANSYYQHFSVVKETIQISGKNVLASRANPSVPKLGTVGTEALNM